MQEKKPSRSFSLLPSFCLHVARIVSSRRNKENVLNLDLTVPNLRPERDRESVSLPRDCLYIDLISTILLGRGATTARESRKIRNAVRLRVSRRRGQASPDGTVSRPEHSVLSFSLPFFFSFFFLPQKWVRKRVVMRARAPDVAQNSTITAEQAAIP